MKTGVYDKLFYKRFVFLLFAAVIRSELLFDLQSTHTHVAVFQNLNKI